MRIAKSGESGALGRMAPCPEPPVRSGSPIRGPIFPLIVGLVLGACAGTEPPKPLDETGDGPENPFLTLAPEVLLQEEEIALLSWTIDDDPELWKAGPPGLRHLGAWRNAVEETLGEEIDDDTDPRFLIRRNRELYPWLEAENEAVRWINREVEAGELGRLRPMNGLESFLLDYHAARYPLVETPSELGTLILSRSVPGMGPRIRVFYLTDGDGLPPKRGVRTVLERAHRDIAAGWDLRTFLHNHTFDFENERGMLAIAAPSPSDLHFIRTVIAPLEPDEAWIVDGFHSIELDADDLANLDLPES